VLPIIRRNAQTAAPLLLLLPLHGHSLNFAPDNHFLAILYSDIQMVRHRLQRDLYLQAASEAYLLLAGVDILVGTGSKTPPSSVAPSTGTFKVDIKSG
jgi:hypothetical protein